MGERSDMLGIRGAANVTGVGEREKEKEGRVKGGMQGGRGKGIRGALGLEHGHAGAVQVCFEEALLQVTQRRPDAP